MSTLHRLLPPRQGLHCSSPAKLVGRTWRWFGRRTVRGHRMDNAVTTLGFYLSFAIQRRKIMKHRNNEITKSLRLLRMYCTNIVIRHVDSPEVQEWALDHPGQHLCNPDIQWDLAHGIAHEYPMWSFEIIRHFVAVAAAEFGNPKTDLDVEEAEQEKAH
jgi:hypothetical protein